MSVLTSVLKVSNVSLPLNLTAPTSMMSSLFLSSPVASKSSATQISVDGEMGLFFLFILDSIVLITKDLL